MMTKCKKAFIASICICLITSVFAQNNYEYEQTWLLAASTFTFQESSPEAQSLSQIATILPKLILSEFDSSPERLITVKEMESKVAYEYDVQQNELYKTLSSQVEKRDIYFFEISEKRAAKGKDSLLVEYESDIQETQEEIKHIQIEKQEALSRVKSNENYLTPIALWNDQLDLYTESSENPYGDTISAVISGSISVRGEYITVDTKLTLYPSREVVFEFSDAGTFQDVDSIAQNIAKHLFPIVLNSKTSQVFVQIEPQEASEKAIVEINGIEYNTSELIELPAGSYSFYVHSEGFESARLQYTIDEEEVYTVSAQLEPLKPVDIAFFAEETQGSLFLNAIPQGELPVTIPVTQESILGEFISTDDNSTFFYINAQDDMRDATVATLSVKIVPNTTNLADEIEKRRKGMYTAYGALLISLPITYITLGQYINAYNSYALGYGTVDDSRKWQQVYDISSGVSIGCGAILVIQLARYLLSANKVIPNQVSPNSIKIEY